MNNNGLVKNESICQWFSWVTVMRENHCELSQEWPKTHHSQKDRHKHDDVIKWKHFPRYWPFLPGIHRSPVNSPNKGQWCGALMFSLICVWINSRVNNREAGDLRRYRTHYDVTVMFISYTLLFLISNIAMQGGTFSQLFFHGALLLFNAMNTKKTWKQSLIAHFHHCLDKDDLF